MQQTLSIAINPLPQPEEEPSVFPRPRLLTRHKIVRKLFPQEATRHQSRCSATPESGRSHTVDGQELTFRLLLAQQQRKYERILEKYNIEERPDDVSWRQYQPAHAV